MSNHVPRDGANLDVSILDTFHTAMEYLRRARETKGFREYTVGPMHMKVSPSQVQPSDAEEHVSKDHISRS